MPGPSLLDCDRDAQKSLHLSLRAARTKLIGGVCGLPGLDQLRRYMIAHLAGARALAITCSDCERYPATEAYTLERGKGEVVLCRELLTGPQKRLDAVLFHELVHAGGGEELDGEGLECHCFPEAATLPGRTDFRLFRKLPPATVTTWASI